MEKSNELNDLINSLIASFKDYDKNLKKRFKVDSIFLGFDVNADKILKKIINLSDSRYKSVKFGIKLNNIINQQKDKYETLIEGIKTDKIYSSNILEPEKSKLLKSVVSVKNREIYDIRDKLINSLNSSRNLFNHNSKLKMNLNKNKSESKVRRNLKLRASYNGNYFQSPTKKRMYNLSNKNIYLRSSTKKIQELDPKAEGQKLIDNLMKEDYKNFFVKMKSYHNFLDKLKSMSYESCKGKGLKINKDNFDHILAEVNPNRLKFLSYTESHKPSTEQKNIKKDLEFDLKTIQKIKLDHEKKNNNIFLKYNLPKSNRTEYNPSTISNYNTITNNKSLTIRSNSSLNDNMTLNSTSRNKRTLDKNLNYKNTAHLVLNETENGLINGEIFMNKTKSFNNYFNKCFSINNDKKNNEKKIKKKEKKIDINNIVPYITKNTKIEDIGKSMRRKTSDIKIKRYEQKDRERIRKEFQAIYDRKRMEWKEEEKMKELTKLKEEQKRKEIENFLANAESNILLKKH
jgi:hypothetical protein